MATLCLNKAKGFDESETLFYGIYFSANFPLWKGALLKISLVSCEAEKPAVKAQFVPANRTMIRDFKMNPCDFSFASGMNSEDALIICASKVVSSLEVWTRTSFTKLKDIY